MYEITKHFWAACDFLQQSKLLFGGQKLTRQEKSALALAKKFCISKFLVVCFQSQYKSFALKFCIKVLHLRKIIKEKRARNN